MKQMVGFDSKLISGMLASETVRRGQGNAAAFPID